MEGVGEFPRPVSAPGPLPAGRVGFVRFARRLPLLIHRSLVRAHDHDCLNLAQSAAYSAMVALFPALIVSAAALALLPDAAPVKIAVGDFFDEVLPPDVLPLLTSYFVPAGNSPHTTRTLVLAAFVSLTGASSVLITLMEGLRRAGDLPAGHWTFLARRGRALLLVPLSLVPLLAATVLVLFGQLLTAVLVEWVSPALQPVVLGFGLGARWAVALAGVAALTASVYHWGVPREPHAPDLASGLASGLAHRPAGWLRSLPGALVATLLWFATTLLFAWYVTRFANYSQVYGSLGAGIALLFWLYLVFLSVLWGAEFNAVLLERRTAPGPEQTTAPIAPGRMADDT